MQPKQQLWTFLAFFFGGGVGYSIYPCPLPYCLLAPRDAENLAILWQLTL